MAYFQSSLRDFAVRGRRNPALEVLGYFHGVPSGRKRGGRCASKKNSDFAIRIPRAEQMSLATRKHWLQTTAASGTRVSLRDPA